jgi:hypothetical protein
MKQSFKEFLAEAKFYTYNPKELDKIIDQVMRDKDASTLNAAWDDGDEQVLIDAFVRAGHDHDIAVAAVERMMTK